MKRIFLILAIMALLIIPVSADQFCSLSNENLTPMYVGERIITGAEARQWTCIGYCGNACTLGGFATYYNEIPITIDMVGKHYSGSRGLGTPPYFDYEVLGGVRLNTVNVTFSISNTSNFADKLSNVTVTISNGQSGITAPNGTVTIPIYPNSDNYTYSLTKSYFVPQSGNPLGVLGSAGGTLYASMVPSPLGGTGYTTTRIFVTDGYTGTPIDGATLNLRETTTGNWTNTTSTVGGFLYSTLDGHTFDIYGSYIGSYTPSYELGAVAGKNYYLPLYTYVAAPVGSVNLLVNMRESGTGYAILNANVNIRYGTGGATTQSANTGTGGSAPFVVPNNTVIIIESSPSGYNGQSVSTTMGTVDKQVTMTLSRATIPTTAITPTVTDPATGAVITAAPTYYPACNPNAPDYNAGQCSKNQDSGMMATLREWGPNILMLAILAVIFGLLKMIMKF